MSGMSPDDFFADTFRVPGESEVQGPPPRYPYPVEHQPLLEVHTLVSTGGPGGWWVIDELAIASEPEVDGEGETWYQVLPWAEWGSSLVRQRSANSTEALPSGQQRVWPRYKRASELWVYRDREEEVQTVDEIGPLDPLAWLSRVQQPAGDPPKVLRPRPARELPSLTGRRLRVSTVDKGWLWVRGLSEPIDDTGGFTVSVCAEADYWRLVYGFMPSGTWLRRPALHTLWSY